MGNERLPVGRTARNARDAHDNTGPALLPAGEEDGDPVSEERPRRLADADSGMWDPEPCPPRSAHIAVVVSSSLCAQVASRQVHADVATPAPIDRAERANKWVVLVLTTGTRRLHQSPHPGDPTRLFPGRGGDRWPYHLRGRPGGPRPARQPRGSRRPAGSDAAGVQELAGGPGRGRREIGRASCRER